MIRRDRLIPFASVVVSVGSCGAIGDIRPIQGWTSFDRLTVFVGFLVLVWKNGRGNVSEIPIHVGLGKKHEGN